MAYMILKRKNKKWSLVHRHYNGSVILKTRTVELGFQESDSLGVFRGMSVEDADTALRLHRADNKAKYHADRRAKFAEIAKNRDMATTAWLPKPLLDDFERDRLPLLNGRKDRWLIAKDILLRLEVPPYDWGWQPELFWRKFQSKGWSLGYVRRLVFYINAWGEFYCKRTGKQWTPIPKPNGTERSRIQLRHFEKRSQKPTAEMTLDHLKRAELKLSPPQIATLKVAFWCGLRKEELDFVLNNEPSNDTWYVDQDRRGFHVFHLFQDKLRRKGIDPRLCWKAVPLVEPEQEEIIPTLQQKAFQRIPLSVLKRDIGVSLTNRSARKGFSVEMEARGYVRECVNEWLGHVGTSTAAKSYRNRRLAMYSPPTLWESKRTG